MSRCLMIAAAALLLVLGGETVEAGDRHGYHRGHHHGRHFSHRHFGPRHFGHRNFGHRTHFGHRGHLGFGRHGGRSHFDLGFYFGGPLYAPAYPAYRAPRVYVAPPVYVEPPVYVQRPAQLWYYCANPAGYYPYVQNCSQPWIPVDPAMVPR